MEWTVLSCILIASCLSIQAEPEVSSVQDNESKIPKPSEIFNSGTPEREAKMLQLKDYMDQGDALLKDRLTESYTNLKELLREGDSVLKEQIVESVAQVIEQRKEGDERLKEELDEDVAWLKDKLAKGQMRMKEELAEEEAKMKEEQAEQREALGRLKDIVEQLSRLGGAVADADLGQQVVEFRAELQSTKADLQTTQEKVNNMEQELHRTREQLQSEVQDSTALKTQLQAAKEEILSLKVRVNSSESNYQSLPGSSEGDDSSAVARKVSCDDGYELACNRCLKAVAEEINYTTARQRCREMQAQLVIAKSSEEIDCIWNHRRDRGLQHTWMGADDMEEPGLFKWKDRTVIPDSSPLWQFGEPDKSSRGTDCVYLHSNDSGLWDAPCRQIYHYICQKEGGAVADADLGQQVVEFRAELQSTKESLQSTQADLQSTQADLQNTQADLQTTQADLQATQADLQTTQADLQTTQADLQSTQADLQATQADLQTTQADLQSTQADLQTTQEKVNSMEQELHRTREQLQSEVQNSTALKTQMQTDLRSTQADLQSTQADLQTTQADLQTTQEKVNSMEQELQRTREQLQSEVQNSTGLKIQLETAEEDILSLKDRVNSSESCCQSLLESSEKERNYPVARKTHCGDGFELACGRCLVIYMDKVNYTTARQRCHDMQARLVMVKSIRAIYCLKAYMMNKGLGFTWLGGSDMEEPGVVKWHDGTVIPDNSHLWQPGEPNKVRSGSVCVCFPPGGRGLWDDPCWYKRDYICQKQ